MKSIVSYYFVGMSLAPLVAFLLRFIFDREYNSVYGTLGTVLSMIYFFVYRKKFKFPVFLIPAFFFLILFVYWDVFHGRIEERGGLFLYLTKNEHIHTIFILFLIANYKLEKVTFNTLIVIFKTTIAVGVIFTLIQLFVDPFFFTHQEAAQSAEFNIYEIRLASVFGYLRSNAVGLTFIPILAIVLSQSILSKDRYLYLWLVMGALICFASNSRYVLLNLFIISYLLVIYKRISNINYFLLIAGLVVLVYFIFYISGFNINEYVNERILDPGYETRFLAWEIFKEFFHKSPFVGSGDDLSWEVIYALRGRSSQIHVGYLALLYAYGIIGCLFLYGFWFLLTRYFYKAARMTNFYGGLFAFLAYLAANLTLVNHSIYRYGIILAVLITKYKVDVYLDKHSEQVDA